jgi:ketosteroid isomerase-like protein
MSQENVEIAKRTLVAFNDRDIDALSALTTEDFEWFPSMNAIEGESFLGRDGIRTYFDRLDGAWEYFHIVAVEWRDQDDMVLLLGRVEGRGKASGATADSPLGIAFNLRDGIVSRSRAYLDHGDALKAMGPSG